MTAASIAGSFWTSISGSPFGSFLGVAQATDHAATGRVLLDILIILVAAKLAAEFAERVSLPPVAAEIVAGIFLGPSVFGIVRGGDVLVTLAELGVLLLLLEVGMHMDIRELAAVGRSALSVALVGVAAPFFLGLLIGSAFGLTQNQTLFAAAALTATSVGITARVFGDLRRLATIEARTVLGAAVADDVIGLIILTVVTRIATGDGPVTAASVIGMIGAALGFLMLSTTLGVLFAPKVFEFIDRHARSSASLFALALAFALAIAQLATLVKLAPIIGAFVAGLSLGRAKSAQKIQRELTPVGHLLIPVFFLQIGINVDARQFVDVNVLGLAAALTAVAVAGKTVAGWAAARGTGDRLTIGLAMVPRGEVGLIFAAIGATTGVLEQSHYAALLLMVLFTTLVAPPLLKWRVARLVSHAPAELEAATSVEPLGGWLVVANDRITLAGTPSPEHLIAIAMPSALAITEGRAPDQELVGWLRRSAPDSTAGWTTKTTASFLRHLEFGTPSSWRFLETTGVLQSALPELATAMAHRWSDPMRLDPAGVDRFPTLDKAKALRSGTVDHADEQRVVRVINMLDHPEEVFLAALLVDCFGEDHAGAQRVLERLCLDQASATEIGLLVADQQLLLATAVRPDGLAAESVLRLAVHLGDEQRAAALYALSIATGGTERWERAAMAELFDMLSVVLEGQRHGNATAAILEAKRRQIRQLATSEQHRLDASALERIESAPISYLLATEPEVVVGHLALLGELSRYRNSAAEVARPSNGAPGWIFLAAHDSLGLLARTTGVLEELGLTIEDASIATWTDGAAVQAFAVRPIRTFFPTASEVERGLAKAFALPLASSPVPDAVISFDNGGSPWHTLCQVRATDRPGLLHAVAVAFAVAGIDVHGARVSTSDELAFDEFELTQAGAGKVKVSVQETVEAVLRKGVVAPSRRRSRLANTFATRPKHSGSATETTRS